MLRRPTFDGSHAIGVRLWKHQEDDVRWLLSRGSGALRYGSHEGNAAAAREIAAGGRGLLGHKVGGGKTYSAVAAAYALASACYSQRADAAICPEDPGLARYAARDKVLILCPLSIIGQWKRAWAECYPHVRVQSAHGAAAGRPFSPQAREAVTSSLAGWDVLLVNYDLLPRLGPLLARIADRFAVVIADEAHRLKGYRGQKARRGKQSKTLYSFVDRIPHHIALTGTPILNGPEDAFGIYRFVDPSIFGDLRWRFVADWFIDVSKSRQYEILKLRRERAEEFKDRIAKWTRRLTKEDLEAMYADQPDGMRFPKEVWKEYRVAMPDSVAKAYKDLKEQSIALLESGEVIERRHVLGRLLGLQMLASGAYAETKNVYLGVADDGEPILDEIRDVKILDPMHKIRAMDDILEEVGPMEPVVIWAHFRHELAMIEAHLRNRFGLQAAYSVHGGVTGAERLAVIEGFQAAKFPYLVCQPGAAGEGLNLQRAGHDVSVSRSWSLKDWLQSNGRICRPGSAYGISTHHVLLAEDTVDLLIYAALKSKDAEAKSLTRDHLLAALRGGVGAPPPDSAPVRVEWDAEMGVDLNPPWLDRSRQISVVTA